MIAIDCPCPTKRQRAVAPTPHQPTPIAFDLAPAFETAVSDAQKKLEQAEEELKDARDAMDHMPRHRGRGDQQQRVDAQDKLDAAIKAKEQAQGAVYAFERLARRALQNEM